MDTWQMIENQFNTVIKPFYDQVDATRKRLNLTPFELKRYKNPSGVEVPLNDVINVTENRSATYMARIIAGLMSAKWQTVVEGNITKREASKIEQFIERNLQQADEYLATEYGLAELNAWLCNHVCHTSLIGAQWMAWIEDGEYKIHCLPLDMRYTPFVLNKWVAPITFRTKQDLLKELEDYEKVAKDGGDNYTFALPVNLKDTDNEVRDFWDEKVNELWVEKQLVFKQRNDYGSKRGPGNFVIIWPPSGFMFRDKNYLEHESPGLLYLNEGLYDQLSRQLSIDATLAFDPLLPSYERPVKNPVADQVSEPVPERGQSRDLPEGELHELVPRPDVNRAQLASRDEVSRMVDEAAPMQPRAYSTPPSAIEVATEAELLGELQNPRIIALQMFKQQLARLIIAQFSLIAGKGSVQAGAIGRQGIFNVADLKDPKKYTISYQLMKQNKRLAIVNEARALAAWGKFPLQYILRDIVGAEDPDGWLREIELERAKSANPAIGLLEMAVRYAEEAEDLEEGADRDLKNWQSIMLQHEYVMLMRQRLQPVPQGEAQNLREATKETGNAQGLISLLGERQPAQLAGVQKGVTVGSQME